jgi:uncharacterized peroxidase-related enzyme
MSGTVREFTAVVPRWAPYVEPVRLEVATAEQLDAMKVTPSNKKVSAYVLTLAHDPEVLKVRSPLFNAIMYGADGLSAPEREMGAVAASVVNRCIYCAAVHASRYNQLTKDTSVVGAIFSVGLAAPLDPRTRALIDFAASLSAAPPAADAGQIEALRAAGFDEIELVDLVLSAAIFGWANRLMHTLGEPVAA